MNHFAYIVVAIQEGRATWANGAFLGSLPTTDPGALESCPDVDVYLNSMGAEGWELCTVTSTPPVGNMQSAWLTKAYLKRTTVR